MQQKLSIQQQQQLKNFGRRSRKDEQGRDYVCGCGKSYLSYPALYTHRKTKHDGLRPEGAFKIPKTMSNSGTQLGKQLQPANSTINTNIMNSIANPNSTPTNPYNSSTNVHKSNQKSAQQSYQQQQQYQPTLPEDRYINSNPKLDINRSLLLQIQQQTTLQDLNLLTSTQLQNSFGQCHPNLRILKSLCGQELYQKYHILVKQSQLYQTNQHDIQIINKYLHPSSKSDLDIILIVYLLSIGKCVSQQLMEYYQIFANQFRNCYYDHGQEIFQVCFKSNQNYWLKNNRDNKQRQVVRERQRERDSLYKCYQYSYPPSSSKSKAYNSTYNTNNANNNTSSVNSSSSNGMTNVTTFNNIIISPQQCKYAPLICDFFIRMYIKQKYLDYEQNIMQLICSDFCSWMYKKKYAIVQVTLNKKYQILKKDCVRMREKQIQTDQSDRNVQFNVQVQGQGVNKEINVKNNVQFKGKKKGKGQGTRLIGSGGISKNQVPPRKGMKVMRNQSISNSAYKSSKKQGKFQQYSSQQEQQLQQNEQNQLNNQQSYKIGHQIVGHEHESALRDRSGSIHQYINGQNWEQMENQQKHNSHQNIINQQGGSNSKEQQQIQQYLNP